MRKWLSQDKKNLDRIMFSEKGPQSKRNQLVKLAEEYKIPIDQPYRDDCPDISAGADASSVSDLTDDWNKTFHQQSLDLYKLIDDKLEKKKLFWNRVVFLLLGVVLTGIVDLLNHFLKN